MKHGREYIFVGLPKVKWLHLSGEVDKSIRFSCKIFLGFTMPNHLNRLFFDIVMKKIIGARFLGDILFIAPL